MTTPKRDRRRRGSPEWVRLGEQLARRRAGLSPDYEGHGGRAAFARDRAVNLKLVQDIELNARENFTPRTLRDDIARAYQVTYESIRRALEGGTLEPAPAVAAVPRVLDDGQLVDPGVIEMARQYGIDPDDPDDPWIRPVREEIAAAVLAHGAGATGEQIFHGQDASHIESAIWDDPRMNRKSKEVFIAIMRANRAGHEAGRRNSARIGLPHPAASGVT